MTQLSPLFDRQLLQKRRQRALKQASEPKCDYLLNYVIQDIIDRISIIQREFSHTLAYGCHTNQLSQSLAKLDQVGTIISTDSLLDITQTLPSPSVVADEEVFPFADNSFDLIISPLNLQWINDLPGTLTQIFKGLKSDGVFIAATLGQESLCELRQCLLQAEEKLSGGASPRIAPFADIRDLGHLLQRAGFALPVTDRDILKVTYPTTTQLMHELRQMGATNNLINRSTKTLQRAFFHKLEEIYRQQFSDDREKIFVTFEVIYLIGWAPHPDQQKPLRPGTGKISLTNVFEKKE